ncbi:IKS protein kinase [Kwoniella heveanensis CBS 569]|nr:IKS protein kinase [Kwoniella heveanensis CBS 569]
MDGPLVGRSFQAWTPIGQTSNQLILYHPPSHALQVRPHPSSQGFSSLAGPSRPRAQSFSTPDSRLRILSSPPIESITTTPHCPYCSQPLPTDHSFTTPVDTDFDTERNPAEAVFKDDDINVPAGSQRRYFRILEQAHEGSRPPSPTPSIPRRRFQTPSVSGEEEEEQERHGRRAQTEEDDDELDEADFPAKGYYDRFFREEKKLGMGAEGSVFLATHVIGGNVLGTYAVKKIAVGRSKSYLFKMLREVRLLEALRHPNIIPYHHSWIDMTRFSSFGPPITALHVLMMYATAGNLDTYLLTRSHTNEPRPDLSANDIADSESLSQLPKAERIKAFKRRRQSAVDGVQGGMPRKRKQEENRGVLLLGVEEIGKLFGDVVEGLAFLHANSILHLDLKCSNVLLHYEEGKLIPKALISDFGTSEEMLRGKRERTGHTGTMEYMAPETLVQDVTGRWRPSDSHADMWSLGMILHKMLFLHLPYPDTEDYEALLKEILAYRGFIPTTELFQSLERRHIPRDLLILLSKLAHLVPEERPTAERVRVGLKGLEDRARSTGSFSSRAGELVRRIVTPWSGVNGELQDAGQGVQSSTWIRETTPTVTHSPVRPILALPSPTDELRTPWSEAIPMLPGSSEIEIGAINATGIGISRRSRDASNFRLSLGRYCEAIANVLGGRAELVYTPRLARKVVRAIVFILKVISLQPQLINLDLNLARSTVLFLLAMSTFEFTLDLPVIPSVALGILHVAAIMTRKTTA